ncbi:MAG: MATE family efflux transporter [Sphaerochaetaceae bacterium]|nr:MATE family efflux transporter [Sphaerochaetaceae bacterium]
MENNNNKAVTENKMGVRPVGSLLFSMSLPAMASMMILALYNVVDSIFVSRFSEAALTAVSLAFPMQTLMIAFAVGLSIGMCSVISRRLGEKREDAALNAASTGYTILLTTTAVFTLIGLFLSAPFFSLYTDNPELLKMGTIYLRICIGLCLPTFILTYCEKVLQATGDTIHPMIIQASGAIFNIIFDPIFIFGYLGFPAMGIAGAALATVLGQAFAMIMGIIFVKRDRYVSIRFSKIRYDRVSATDIFKVGLPSVVMQGIGTIMTSLMNAILITYDILATTVFGVCFKLQSFVFMPVFGMNQGLMPILGYNYGARNRARMVSALKIALITALIIMTAGTVVIQLIPDKLFGLFNASPRLLEIGCTAFRLISLSYPLAAVSIILGSLFQALGDGYMSMITSIVRQILFLVPVSWLLGKIGGLHMIWYSFIISEFFALFMTLFFFSKENKKFKFD